MAKVKYYAKENSTIGTHSFYAVPIPNGTLTFDELLDEACLSIRQWVGKPYAKGSTQREIARLTCKDGIGIQKMTVAGITAWHPIFVNGNSVNTEDLAHNDGLEKADWCNWFADYDLTEPLAVIHFTKYRY